ncbi:MAG: Cerebroside-sulfatase, partial [Verrucomicrobia bacterium]|nr:Cerebroside-sulfatase [Verrucomicrobiota bacterium]
SFASRLRGQGASRRSFAYSEEAVLPKPGGVEPDGISSGLKWVRTQEWKLYNDGRLYHMREDPSEQYPLHAKQDDSKVSGIRRQLQVVYRGLGLQ